MPDTWPKIEGAVGSIDATSHETCHPTNNQEHYYTSHRHYHCLHIRYSSADSVSKSNSNCIKMASILNSELRDLQHGSTCRNGYCEVIILLMKCPGRLKDKVKSIVYKMFNNEIDGILKIVFSPFLAPLAEGQRAIVMALCPSFVHACVRPSVNSSFKKLLRNY